MLILKTSWRPSESSLTLTGILIEGGILEGILKPCSSNSENVTAAPNCYLQWIRQVSLVEESKLIQTTVV